MLRSIAPLIAGLILVLGSSPATAGPVFDSIHSAHVRINSNGSVGVSTSSWGWIVATTETIPEADFLAGSLSVSIDSPSVSPFISSSYMNLHIHAPLAPGEIAGSQNVSNAAALDPFIVPGETFTGSASIYGVGFSFPAFYNSTDTATITLKIGDQVVTYDTIIEFAPFPNTFLAVAGERLSSVDAPAVPEPGSLALMMFGTVGLSGCGLRRRFSKAAKRRA